MKPSTAKPPKELIPTEIKICQAFARRDLIKGWETALPKMENLQPEGSGIAQCSRQTPQRISRDTNSDLLGDVLLQNRRLFPGMQQ